MKFLKGTPQVCRQCNGNPSDGYEEGCLASAFIRQPEVTGSIMHSVVPNEVSVNGIEEFSFLPTVSKFPSLSSMKLL